MRAVAVMCLLVLAGCGGTGPGSPGPDRSELTRDEIARTSYTNVFDLITAERPHWLRTRGQTSFQNEPTIGVYTDGVRLGGPESLRQLSPSDVESIRFYDAREAQFRFGTGHSHGALNVTLRRR